MDDDKYINHCLGLLNRVCNLHKEKRVGAESALIAAIMFSFDDTWEKPTAERFFDNLEWGLRKLTHSITSGH